MIPAAMITLILVVIALIGMLATAFRTQTWKEAARRHGLEYSESGLFGLKPHIRGRLDGVPVRVDVVTRSSGENSSSYTVVRADPGAELPRGLRLHKEGLGTSVVKLLGGQDIQIGVDEVDKKWRIRGESETVIAGLLRDPEVRRGLVDLAGSHRYSRVDGGDVVVEASGSGGRNLDSQLALATRLAAAMATGMVAPWQRVAADQGLEAHTIGATVSLFGRTSAGRVSVEADPCGTRPTTIVRVPLHEAVSRSLVIELEGKRTHRDAVRLGDPVLDGRVAVTGVDHAAAAEVFAGPLAEQLDLRGRLLAVLHGRPGSVVADGVVIGVRWRGADAAIAGQMVEEGLALAEALSLCAGGGWSGLRASETSHADPASAGVAGRLATVTESS